MKASELRAAILLVLDEHYRADPSRTVDDTEIVEALDVPLQEVRRQLDVLEEQGFTKSANTFGGHSAYLAPKGMAQVDELREAFEDHGEDPARPIGFE